MYKLIKGYNTIQLDLYNITKTIALKVAKDKCSPIQWYKQGLLIGYYIETLTKTTLWIPRLPQKSYFIPVEVFHNSCNL